eukprot:g5622.t1
MRQINILPAGVQGWHKEVIGTAIATDAILFAYASTLALYVYRKDGTGQPRVWKILTGHSKSIRCFEWAAHNPNFIVTAGADGKIVIWNLDLECEETVVSPAVEGPLLGVPLGDCIRWNSQYKAGQRNPRAEVLLVGKNDGSLHRWASDAPELAKIADIPWSAFEWQTADSVLVGTTDGHLWRVPTRQTQTNGPPSFVKLFVHPEQTKTGPRCDVIAKDPLCDDYLITAFSDGSLFLIAASGGATGPLMPGVDLTASSVLFAFEKQPIPVEKIVWLPSQPGSFFSCSKKQTTLQLWNASQAKPLEKLKPANAAGANIFSMCSFRMRNPERLLIAYTNGALSVVDVTSNTGSGGVGASRVTTLRPSFTSSAAHSETIFDLAFCPANANVFATASYDGYVRLWNVAKRESFREMYGGDGIFYAVAWCADGSMVAATSSHGHLFVWKSETGALILKHKAHEGNMASYRLQWCPSDPFLIATGGCDNLAVITHIGEKTAKRSYRHPMVVIGVAFNPLTVNIFATACQDGLIRVWDVNVYPHDNQPLFALSGHVGRVFNVTWHPVFRNLLASGSDDTTIRIWDAEKKCECMRLSGHTSYVRALCWHSEVLQILLSGSWDETIRVWDVSQGICLHTARQHHADVYGLDAHPARPFMFISSSRDTTIRFWTVEELAAPFLLSAVLEPQNVKSLSGTSGPVCGPEFFVGAAPPAGVSAADAASPLLKHTTIGGTVCNHSPVCYPRSENVLLFGEGFRTLLQRIDALPAHPLRIIRVYRLLFHFFYFRTNQEDLWALLEHNCSAPPGGGSAGSLQPSGLGGGGLSSGARQTEIHQTIACVADLAPSGSSPTGTGRRRQVDIVTGKSSSSSSSTTSSKHSAIDAATQIWHQSVLGQEIRTQANALASTGGGAGGIIGVGAPKKEERLQKAALMMLRIGNVRQYCEFMASADQWEKAIMAAPMVSAEFWQKMHRDYLQRKGYCLPFDGRAVGLLATENAGELVDGYLRPGGVLVGGSPSAGSRSTGMSSPPNADQLGEVCKQLADQYFDAAQPVSAACMLVSNNNVADALDLLLRGNELLLYHVCHSVLQQGGSARGSGMNKQHQAAESRRRTASQDGVAPPLGVVWECLGKQCERFKLRELARQLYGKAVDQAETLSEPPDLERTDPGHQLPLQVDGQTSIRVGEPAVAASQVLDALLVEIAAREHGSLQKMKALLAVVESVNLTADLADVGAVVSILACAAYVGFVEAFLRGYSEILHSLAQTVQNIVVHRQLAFPVSTEELFALDAILAAKAFPRGVRTLEKLNKVRASAGVPSGSSLSPQLLQVVDGHVDWLGGGGSVTTGTTSTGSANMSQLQGECPPRNVHWLLDKMDEEVWRKVQGSSMVLAGSVLPSERNAAVSVLSSEVIKGPSFLLEDGQNKVSLKEALLWGRVNACSPLNTGYPVMPF